LEKKLKLLDVEKAEKIILRKVKPLKGNEKIDIRDSFGRVLISNLNSKRNQPELDLSAMDGYAVRKRDLSSLPKKFELVGEIKAGDKISKAVKKNQTFRIFTGAPIPKGANKVVIQENCLEVGKEVLIKSENKETYIRKKSHDISKKFTLKAPRLISTRDIALLGAMNHKKINVYKKPKVGILATGDEIIEVGDKTNIFNQPASSKPSIISLIKNWGGEPIDMGIARDNYEDLIKNIKKGRKFDLFVTIGGASVGKYDLIQKSLSNQGFTMDFWKLAMQPGKPLMFGTNKNTSIIGLPGNPVSALVCCEIFLKKAVYALQGIKYKDTILIATLDNDLNKNGLRRHYLRGKLYFDHKKNEMIVKSLNNQDSASLLPYSEANSLIILEPNEKKLRKGSKVKVFLLNN
tara:strand:+ start:167 stop:1381 length:1215 start_codon:yes stop_codon:yes gene_type:complete